MAIVQLPAIDLDQAEAGQEIPFVVENTSNVRQAGETIGSIVAELMKPGDTAWGAVDGSVHREIANGWYVFQPTTTDVDTLGVTWFRFKSGANEYCEVPVNVKRYAAPKDVSDRPASNDPSLPRS